MNTSNIASNIGVEKTTLNKKTKTKTKTKQKKYFPFHDLPAHNLKKKKKRIINRKWYPQLMNLLRLNLFIKLFPIVKSKIDLSSVPHDFKLQKTGIESSWKHIHDFPGFTVGLGPNMDI